jgi:hypothetical protein
VRAPSLQFGSAVERRPPFGLAFVTKSLSFAELTLPAGAPTEKRRKESVWALLDL